MLETFKKKYGHTPVPCVRNCFLISNLSETRQICTSMNKKKAGHFSVPSNLTEKFRAIFLASLNHSLLIYVYKNEDAGNLLEKIWPYTCSTCEKLFYYLPV